MQLALSRVLNAFAELNSMQMIRLAYGSRDSTNGTESIPKRAAAWRELNSEVPNMSSLKPRCREDRLMEWSQTRFLGVRMYRISREANSGVEGNRIANLQTCYP